MLDRLRTAANGRRRPTTSIRTGLQEPQRVQTLVPAPARARSRG